MHYVAQMASGALFITTSRQMNTPGMFFVPPTPPSLAFDYHIIDGEPGNLASVADFFFRLVENIRAVLKRLHLEGCGNTPPAIRLFVQLTPSLRWRAPTPQKKKSLLCP